MSSHDDAPAPDDGPSLWEVVRSLLAVLAICLLFAFLSLPVIVLTSQAIVAFWVWVGLKP